MRSPAYLAIGVLVLGLAAVASPMAQQTPAPSAQTPPPSGPPRSNQPGGLAGAVSPSTPPVEYSDAAAGESNFVVGVQPPYVQVWINDSLVTDAHEATNRAEGGIVQGPMAIQMHGGSRWVQAGFWRWRNVGIKEL